MNKKRHAERFKISIDFNLVRCNLEVIRLIRNMPECIPAENNGQKMKTRMIIPVQVKIEK
jgi:hypothetical protein